MSEKTVVTRFAPSPTGFMHVGGIRTALFAYAYAKKNGGTFILRIEDTDKAREVAGAKEHIMEALNWLGIHWDFGPDKPSPVFGSCVQSERLDIYYEYAARLLLLGYAYVDPYTEHDIEKWRKEAEENKKIFLYRDHRPAVTDRSWMKGKTLRFKVPEIKRYSWHDAVRGDLEEGEEALDDFVLIKADGYPTYNFCHIVDDIEMGVTHIMRGQEFISSTPKFLSLYKALSVEPPVFVTLPPILGEGGNKKLSKRDGAKDVLDYRSEGYLPEAIVNFLALLGWNPGGDREIITPEEIVQEFDISRVQKAGAQLSEEKLEWINKEYIKRLPPQKAIDMMMSYFPKDTHSVTLERLRRMAPTALERIHALGEYYADFQKGEYEYLTENPEYKNIQITWKEDGIPKAIEHLQNCLSFIDATTVWTIESIKEHIFPYADQQGRGSVLWPLRVALSGKEKSPDPFTLIYVLGPDSARERITNAIVYLSK